MRLLIGSIAWLALCAVALVYAWKDIKQSDIEADHEEALEMDAEWSREGWPVGLPPVRKPAPPILDQSSAWQDRLRSAEGNEDDWDRGDAA